MSVLDTIQSRYSVRKYESREVSEDVMQYILEAARWAQSAKNLQEWRLVVIRNQQTKNKLAIAAKGQQFVSEAPCVIACCAEGTNYIMTCGQYSYVIDVAIAMENMALAAHERGLGTCWLGAFHEEEVKKILSIPDGIRVVGLMTLGYAVGSRPNKSRKILAEIVRYESW